MSLLLAILGRAWPYLLTLGAGAGLSGWAVHSLDNAKYETYQAQVQKERASEATAAAQALQAQITTRLTTEANNGKVLSQLQAERDTAVSDRDVAVRLLAAAQARTASHPMSSSADRSGAHDPAPAPGNGSAPDLIGLTQSAVAEFRDCLERYSALQAELAPQLAR